MMLRKLLIKNTDKKAGWIKIVEAFFAILLIVGVVLFLINKGFVGADKTESKVFTIEKAILKEIQLDRILRNAVLESTPPYPAIAHDLILNKIDERKPNYLDCTASVCDPDEACGFPVDRFPPEAADKDIYGESILITSSLVGSGGGARYDPKKLKIFCWVN
jgi:hypothetical protein